MIATATFLLALQTGPPRDARGPVRGTAVLSGIVVSDDAEARPVRKARVTCGSPDVPGHTTITDEGGRFVFARLPAGRYMVGASKAAWVTTSYGAKRPLRPGSAIPLADGQKLEITVRMARGSVITGVVLDHNNQPSAGTAVSALRPWNVEGERRLAPAAHALTDDRGIYRIYGLAAGDYIVGAAGQGLSGPELRLTSDADVRHALSANARTPPPPDRSVSMATTYYPGGTLVSQAGLISVRAGEERGGVDFTLELVPTSRVEGTVLLPEGGAPPGTEVDLISIGQSSTPGVAGRDFRMSGAGRDGTFSFANVPPGQYRLLARALRPIAKPDGSGDDPPRIMWASTQVAVEGEPVTGLTLALEPGLAVFGQVRFEGTALTRPADLRSIRVSATPVDVQGGVVFVPGAAAVGPDGRFSIAGLTPGKYRLAAAFPGFGRPGGWALKSIIAAGQDSLDAPFTLQPNQHVLDATITFTDRLAQVSGTLLDAAGGAAPDYTVVIFPMEEALWARQSRRIQGVRPGADGAYVIRNLPAGTYLVAAVDEVEPGEWFDPAFLQRLAPAAMKLAVADGEQVTHNVRISSGR
jgi:carboxypeptidase family protein